MPVEAAKTETPPAATGTKRSVVSHVAAGIGAVLCVAVIAQASFERTEMAERAAATEMPMVLDAASVVGVLNSAFTADGVRNKPRYPMEFESVLGPTTLKSFDVFASAGWPSVPQTALAVADRAAPAKPVTVARACAGSACRVHLAESQAMLPPPRPALALPPSAVAELTPAKPLPTRVALAEERRVRLLGVSLPGFVPTGDTIVKTVVSWGGSVADLVPRI